MSEGADLEESMGRRETGNKELRCPIMSTGCVRSDPDEQSPKCCVSLMLLSLGG